MQDRAKQAHRQELLELKASQAGVVKDIATHTAGTVVQPGTVEHVSADAADPSTGSGQALAGQGWDTCSRPCRRLGTRRGGRGSLRSMRYSAASPSRYELA